MSRARSAVSLALAAKAILMHGSEVEPEVALAVPSILAGAARRRLTMSSKSETTKAHAFTTAATHARLEIIKT